MSRAGVTVLWIFVTPSGVHPWPGCATSPELGVNFLCGNGMSRSWLGSFGFSNPQTLVQHCGEQKGGECLEHMVYRSRVQGRAGGLWVRAVAGDVHWGGDGAPCRDPGEELWIRLRHLSCLGSVILQEHFVILPFHPILGEPWQGRGAAVQLNSLYLISVHLDVSWLTLFTATWKISHVWKSWFCQRNSSEFLGDLQQPPYFICVKRPTSASVPSPDPHEDPFVMWQQEQLAQEQLCLGSLTPLTLWHSCASCDHLGTGSATCTVHVWHELGVNQCMTPLIYFLALAVSVLP